MSGIRVGNAESALNRLRQHDLERRRTATTILSPTAVAGKTSPAKVLYTTLGGVARPITQQDLATFRTRIAEVGKDLRSGVTAAEAINLSRPIDRERANKEIRYAVPTLVRGGEVRFLTDSGPQSKVTRHHTRIEFVNWSAAIARPATALQSATWLCREGSLRLECQCEAFTFWGFRYIASIGGYVLGRKESAYPKIRQPTLAGCLCKHLIRTLTTLQADTIVRKRIADAIEGERRRLDMPTRAKPVAVRVTQAEADRITTGRSRRIVVNPGQRGAKLPQPASASDIQTALRAFTGKRDMNSVAIARALQNLLAAQQKAVRP
ncbi:hypothetical protein ACSFA7_22575 [Variovorax sp. LT1R20]|uniref:hypothetical protein n=1 Tax=Variovorax sp. LT1R20 TaxID=3443729 RepID=UPI003F46FD57